MVEQYKRVLNQKGQDCKPFPLFLRFVPEALTTELAESLKGPGGAHDLLSAREGFLISGVNGIPSGDPAAASKALESVARAAAHLVEHGTLPVAAAAAAGASQAGTGSQRRKQGE